MKKKLIRLFPYLCVILAVLLCSRYACQVLLIQGQSMEPTYHSFQMVLVNRRDSQFEQGDVVAFHCQRLDTNLVKRIAACPGDLVQIRDGTLYVNNEISQIYFQAGCFTYAGLLELSVQLGSDEYIVIGDNLEQSKDSRYDAVGIVSQQDILGKLIPCKPFLPQTDMLPKNSYIEILQAALNNPTFIPGPTFSADAKGVCQFL